LIRQCSNRDIEVIYTIINDAARVYKSVIPEDCWQEPYMSKDELRQEISRGIVFWGYEEDGKLAGVMGIQHVQDVTLIRHAYVLRNRQRQGIGGKLLPFLCKKTFRLVLVGTWADAFWAVNFYKKHDFELVPPQEKGRLLTKYWSIPKRQAEVSVVLADENWFKKMYV